MYDFKRLQEIGWFALTAILVYVAEILASFDPEAVATDWRSYVVALAGGCIRAAFAAVLAQVRPSNE